MTWRWCVCRESFPPLEPDGEPEIMYTLRELFFGENGEPSWTVDPISPSADTWLEMADTLALVAGAAGRPVLDLTVDPPVLRRPGQWLDE